jgi:hypothetical protein
MSRIAKALLTALLTLALAGCAHQPTPDAYDPAGFFTGLFNGFTIFFSLVGSIFWMFAFTPFQTAAGGTIWASFWESAPGAAPMPAHDN